MKELILGIWLGVQAGADMRYREVSFWFSVLGGIVGIGSCIIEKRVIVEILIACLPGVLLLGFSCMTKEVIGYGDGIILTVMGIYLPIRQVLSIGMLAFSLAGVVALFLLVVLRKRGDYRIPFIPFLALAYGIEYLVRIGGGR